MDEEMSTFFDASFSCENVEVDGWNFKFFVLGKK